MGEISFFSGDWKSPVRGKNKIGVRERRRAVAVPLNK